jgi:hypothetical protein
VIRVREIVDCIFREAGEVRREFDEARRCLVRLEAAQLAGVCSKAFV